jgi:DNA-binding Lrp family transcriptional regulator
MKGSGVMAFKRFVKLDDVEWLTTQYAVPRSMQDLADEIGCSAAALKNLKVKLELN